VFSSLAVLRVLKSDYFVVSCGWRRFLGLWGGEGRAH